MILTIVERVLIKRGTTNSWERSHKNWLDMRKSKWDYLYNNGGIIGFTVGMCNGDLCSDENSFSNHRIHRIPKG